MQIKRFKRPSAAFVVAMIALFVALGGTAGAVVTAAVPLAKRALVSDNAKKLNGLTAVQVATAGARAGAALAAQTPPSSVSALVTSKSAPFSVSGGKSWVLLMWVGMRVTPGARQSAAGSPTRRAPWWSVRDRSRRRTGAAGPKIWSTRATRRRAPASSSPPASSRGRPQNRPPARAPSRAGGCFARAEPDSYVPFTRTRV